MIKRGNAAYWLRAGRKPSVAAAVNRAGSWTPSRAISMIRMAKSRFAVNQGLAHDLDRFGIEGRMSVEKWRNWHGSPQATGSRAM